MRRKPLILLAVAVCLLPLGPSRTRSAPPAHRWRQSGSAWADPLTPMIRATDDYLQKFEVNGVTMDWRYSVIPSEEIRQTVVCQLLAYVELARLDPRARLRLEIVHHADFLISRMDSILSHTPFDGMLAYSLLGAYEITREQRFLDAGSVMMTELLAIPTSECVLNGGLMVAMATAEYARLTGDATADQKTHDIVAQLAPYQNPDGSFPHWCVGSRDIHYTGWMGMELVHIARMVNDAHIDPYLTKMAGFLEGRIGPDGRAVYEEPCPGVPNCTNYYYSRATGCPQDLDSRGWTVEPAYCGLLFDREGAPEYQPVMTFLDSLEVGGTIPDLYAYWPPPSDPEYPWTTADTSVVCMSINLWVLSTAVAERIRRNVPVNLVLDDLIDTTSIAPPAPPPVYESRPLSIQPNPAAGSCALRFSLPKAVSGSLRVFDASGRRVRTLVDGELSAGVHSLQWDGRDDAGRVAPSGVYFARLKLGENEQTRRIVMRR
jgi:FlgD Ig-like domain